MQKNHGEGELKYSTDEKLFGTWTGSTPSRTNINFTGLPRDDLQIHFNFFGPVNLHTHSKSFFYGTTEFASPPPAPSYLEASKNPLEDLHVYSPAPSSPTSSALGRLLSSPGMNSQMQPTTEAAYYPTEGIATGNNMAVPGSPHHNPYLTPPPQMVSLPLNGADEAVNKPVVSRRMTRSATRRGAQ